MVDEIVPFDCPGLDGRKLLSCALRRCGRAVVLGAGERGIGAALAATARLAFLFFWPAYSASAMTSLFGPAFLPLKRRGREFGLAFVSVLLVHLGLVALLCLSGHPPEIGVFIVFGIAAAWAFLFAFFSFGQRRSTPGPKTAWVLRNVGMNYLAYAFAIDFFRDPFHGDAKHLIEYAPFALLSVLGPGLRVAAWAQHIGRRWSESNSQ